MSADGTRLFVSHPGANFVSVVNAGTLGVVATVDANPGPYGMAYDRTLDRLYAVSAGNATVTASSMRRTTRRWARFPCRAA
jgi:YVTN family beta-propeller protein